MQPFKSDGHPCEMKTPDTKNRQDYGPKSRSHMDLIAPRGRVSSQANEKDPSRWSGALAFGFPGDVMSSVELTPTSSYADQVDCVGRKSLTQDSPGSCRRADRDPGLRPLIPVWIRQA